MFRQLACVLFCTTALAQASERYAGPIIDMHIHVYAKDPRWDADVANPVTGHKITAKSEEAHRTATVAQFKQHNIVGAMVGNDLEVARRWRDALGKDIWIGYAIEDPAAVDWVVLEREARARHIDAIAEVAPYYAGIAPDDARLEPMWKLAEELDLPVGFHVHPGPPGPLYMGMEEARADNVSPKALDKVLVRHPKLRLLYGQRSLPDAIMRRCADATSHPVKPRWSAPTTWVRFPVDHAFASTRARNLRSRVPRGTRDARRRAMGGAMAAARVRPTRPLLSHRARTPAPQRPTRRRRRRGMERNNKGLRTWD